MSHHWTDEELKILKENWGVLGIKSLAARINRSEKSIRRKAERLGLKLGTRHEWTPEEISRLRDHKDYPMAILDKMFPNHPKNSIYLRARAEGRKKLQDNIIQEETIEVED